MTLEGLSPQEKARLPAAKGNDVESFLEYRAREAAGHAGVSRGALMKMRWLLLERKREFSRLNLSTWASPIRLGRIETALPARSRLARQTFLGASAWAGPRAFKGARRQLPCKGILGREIATHWQSRPRSYERRCASNAASAFDRRRPSMAR